MTRAQHLLAQIVREVDTTGFTALGVHALIGDDVAEHRWAPDVRIDIQSVSKGVCVFAALIAETEGLVSLDAPVSALLPDHALGADVDQVTLRHLLTMTSGIDLPWSETLMTDWPDLAREFLSRPSSGRRFQYSNASTYTAMTALAAVVGDVAAFLTPRLFDPIGVDPVEWDRCPHGRIIAGGGLRLRTSEMARMGRLIRDRGRWDGVQLIPADGIDAMHAEWVDAGTSPDYDRYALAGWGGPGDAWRLHGAYGQLLIFRGDAVVTITADDHFGADAFAARVVEILEEDQAKSAEPT